MLTQKVLSHIILTIFFSMIFAVPVYWIFIDKNEKINSIEEARSISTIPALPYSQFKKAVILVIQGKPAEARTTVFNFILERKFQKLMETALSDRFPLRLTAIKTSKAFDRKLIALAYMFLNDPAIPADTQSNIYVMRDHSKLILRPMAFDTDQKKRIEKVIRNYETLIRLFPHQKFYVFYIQTLKDSKSNPLNSYFKDADDGRAIQYFEEKLPEGLVLGKMMLSSFEDRVEYFFKTDHHWNIRGACHGYGLIYPMLALNYPGIPPKRDCGEYMTLPGVNFLGSYARITLYPIEPEAFEVSTAKLPPYKILLDGQETQHTKLDQYLAGDFNPNPYKNHYQEIFGHVEKPIEYYFKDNPRRNLLIIGSSFRKPIEPFIASHYSHTYVMPINYFQDFSLGKFLLENHVDDILIIGEFTVTYGSEGWQINP
jgi:hypothetical protein